MLIFGRSPILFVSACFILVVAAYLRTALSACRPLILLFSRCRLSAHGTGCVSALILLFSRCGLFAHGTGCVSAFDFIV